jgi:hypothetical protein
MMVFGGLKLMMPNILEFPMCPDKVGPPCLGRTLLSLDCRFVELNELVKTLARRVATDRVINHIYFDKNFDNQRLTIIGNWNQSWLCIIIS